MVAVVFYEKPGCLTNAGQKALLADCGCELTVRNLLTEPWTEVSLYEFLRALPVAQWFNPAAPRIKSGEIDPAAQDTGSAMTLLLGDPLLIRRPLLDTGFGKTAGFDDSVILRRLGVCPESAARHQGCSNPGDAHGCGQAE
jgi:nitrogenase-associated protein